MLVRTLEITKAKKKTTYKQRNRKSEFLQESAHIGGDEVPSVDLMRSLTGEDWMGRLASNHPVHPPLIGGGPACLRHRYPRDRVIGYL